MGDAHLDKSFPIPSVQPPSSLSPRAWPGSTPESTTVLRELLQENHKRWHYYIDEVGRHNHTTHHLLALWSLGADANVLKAAYTSNCEWLLPAVTPPGAITKDNFKDHLGKHEYYNAYEQFFEKELESRSVSDVLEEFIFSTEYNFDSAREAAGKEQPSMVVRFLDAIVHPLIHVGYGLELSIPGMVTEGLAGAAIHRGTASRMMKPAFFEQFSQPYGSFTSAMSLALNKIIPSAAPKVASVHPLSIIARIRKDTRFDDFKPQSFLHLFDDMVNIHGDTLVEYANQWNLDFTTPDTVDKKFEELVWAVSVMYGIGGWNEGKGFQADFFNMHLITSSVFLPSILPYLSPRSQGILLRSFFLTAITWWVGHGRGYLDVRDYFKKDTAHPEFPGPRPTPIKGVFPSTTSPSAITPNPWLPIIQSAIVHTDEHLPKIQRALAHYAHLYGNRVAGLPDFAETELEGAEWIDGSLFVRIAGMTAEYLGRMREGESGVLTKDKGHNFIGDFWSYEGFAESR
ncbi:hypothetical protein HGRIS_010955 [Hohenbuehelia grisea]|uniref:Uncharacterized protein n=1 Tax=Hohenbuehelia grisea TaxID=104357 RepID=A0ABR3IYP0_9AGAR